MYDSRNQGRDMAREEGRQQRQPEIDKLKRKVESLERQLEERTRQLKRAVDEYNEFLNQKGK